MKIIDSGTSKEQLLTIFSKALQAVNGRRSVLNFLRDTRRTHTPTNVVAIGKAAESMLTGAIDFLGDQLNRALLITKKGYVHNPESFPTGIRFIESAHPYPDQSSLEAGKVLLNFVGNLPPEEDLLFLVSGGTSALVEVLPDTVDLNQYQQLSTWLLAQGWPIDVMNRIRKSVSCIKAGRLAKVIRCRNILQLLISDVPGNEISAIGSGLLVTDSDDANINFALPDWIKRMQALAPPLPESSEACFSKIESRVIASNENARSAAAELARDAGFTVQCNEPINGTIHMLGEQLAHRILNGHPGVYIWGGEGTIELPENPGNGGRAQALALYAAQHLQGTTGMVLLSAGTDGTDGPGDAAGAIVDGATVMRGEDAGLDVNSAILNADAGRFLEGSGDLIDTGPTGTNVMDLVIGLKY